MPNTDFKAHDGLLTVRQTSDQTQLRVALEGEMDLSNSGFAESVLREALASGRSLVVDLGKLEFVDSTGIAMLIRAIADSDEGRLSFLPSEHEAVRRLFSLTGLDERMPFAADKEIPRPVEGSAALAKDAEPLLRAS
ncbi:MAG TPA: STAS domain-containing protein [Solirubrobacterales bacterium]|nr:STAS domain-containing protein [Solirubrobacterales bacterium]